MIVKRNFSPVKVWGYVQNQVLYTTLISTILWLTSLCNTIERDLKEFLNEKILPSTLNSVNGYLFQYKFFEKYLLSKSNYF